MWEISRHTKMTNSTKHRQARKCLLLYVCTADVTDVTDGDVNAIVIHVVGDRRVQLLYKQAT